MKKYMKYSTNIYNVYLKYFSPDDICVYSIDEVFIDVTHYLKNYQMKASQLATKVIHDIYKQTGITATCGVGTIVLDVGYDIEIVNYNWIHFNISIINRREVEVDMEKCKKRNTEHCTKSKFIVFCNIFTYLLKLYTKNKILNKFHLLNIYINNVPNTLLTVK